eukprot:TRINITY_DN15508_c0_g1_i1.p2 TRINITY_DN15508_c0_g1~~TRINITY_DN15508_c0_g1_i1.p2  ORF type:complete len:163 (+),score=36.06 TRINITY_DN15508_c0_g1_i1:3-491(+)
MLEQAIRWFYPSLAGVPIEARWEGVIAINFDDRPSVGRCDNLYHALAYCGHGVVLSNHVGVIIRDLFLGRDSRYTRLSFVNTAVLPIPGEPWLSLVDWTYVNALRWLDARLNASATAVVRRTQPDWPQPPPVHYARPPAWVSMLSICLLACLLAVAAAALMS